MLIKIERYTDVRGKPMTVDNGATHQLDLWGHVYSCDSEDLENLRDTISKALADEA